jgi:CheY-like chemotaxis protein
MNKVLIVEDTPERHEQFIKNFLNCDLTIVETASEAIKCLKSVKYDYLFLDYCLGWSAREKVDSKYENSGEGVSKFLKDNPKYKPGKIYLHSSNSYGREIMNMDLPEAIEVPNIWTRVLKF